MAQRIECALTIELESKEDVEMQIQLQPIRSERAQTAARAVWNRARASYAALELHYPTRVSMCIISDYSPPEATAVAAPYPTPSAHLPPKCDLKK